MGLKELVKKYNWLGSLYARLGKFGYKVLDICTPKDSKMILFSSFSGRQFSDSPKEIYLALKNDERFSDYKLVWALDNPESFSELQSIKSGSFKFYIYLFRAKFWVSNASIEKLIPLNSKQHVYIDSWHGIPFKKLGLDEAHVEPIVKHWYKNVRFDLLFSCSEYDNKIFHRIFPNTKNIVNADLPRNLRLANYKAAQQDEMIKKLGINHKKSIILYAPTFRDYNLSKATDEVIKTLKSLAENYTVLVREHYFSEIELPDSILNVSDYPDLNDLMIASDMLISDYSSLIFDYSLLHKPIYLYTYDWKEYSKYRGFYLSPLELNLPNSFDGEDLIKKVNDSGNYDISIVNNIAKKYHTNNDSIDRVKKLILSEE